MINTREFFFPKIAFSLLLAYLLSFAVHQKVCATDLPLQYLGIEKGLSNNSVNCIFKDHYGFMWMGTYDGLNRYDGYNFTVFRNIWGDKTSLFNNDVKNIAEDNHNHVWIGTQKGLGYYNYQNAKFYQAYFKNNQQPLTSKINKLLTDDSQKDLFVCSDQDGLLLVKNGSTSCAQIKFKNSCKYNVEAIAESNGQIWLFIKNYGLCSFNRVSNEISLIDSTLKDANCLLSDQKQLLWIGTNKGLYKFNTIKKAIGNSSKGLTNDNVVNLLLDKTGQLWIGTNGGGVNILNLTTNAFTYLLPQESKGTLTSAAITAIYQDNEDRKWITTLRGGVNIVDSRQQNRFRTISHNPSNPNSLVNNFSRSFCEDEIKNLWIGTSEGGLSYWDVQKNRFTNFRHQANNPATLSSNIIVSIVKDHQNKIWIASFSGGIDLYNKASQSFKHYDCFDAVRGTVEKSIWYLYEDSSNNLWAGTTRDGALFKYNRKQDKFELFDERLTNIHTIYEDRGHNLWGGNYTQLIKIDKNSKKHQFIKINNAIRSIYEDKLNHFWIGTDGGGLLQFDRKNNTYTRYTQANGLPSNTVLTILEDSKGCLWLSTYNGLSKFNPNTKTFKNYYSCDGLQSNQFNYNAGLKLSSGEFVFGGIKGFNIFNPDSIKPNSHEPELRLTGLKINDIAIEKKPEYRPQKPVISIDKITVPYNEATVSFDFVALEYSFPDKISYAYYLEGWDHRWNTVGKLKTAYYSRLNEGNYVLKIKCTDAEGVWGSQIREIRVTVLPPWYRAWWAYLGYASFITLFLYWLWRYHHNQTRLKYEVEITNLKAAREKELNEKKLSFFTNISHEFRTPLTLIINPIKDLLNHKGKDADQTDLNIVYRNAKRLLSLVNQLLLFRKAESETDLLKIVEINFYELCKEIYQCFIYQAKKQHILYEFKCENEQLKLYADREKLEIILFNLISNALKFTPGGGTITVEVGEDAKNVFLSVKDTGCGIGANIEQKLFDKFYQSPDTASFKTGFGIGLYLVKNFINSHKGSITYETELGKGTQFLVIFLKGNRHFAPENLFEDDTKTRSILDELDGETVFTEEKHDASFTGKKLVPPEDLVSDQQSILVVDDDEQIRQYITSFFEPQYRVFMAESAETGFILAKQHLPNIIISDVMMQGQSGIDLCNQIKSDAHLNHIPMILLTASSAVEMKLKGLEEGADDYINKPFEKDLLIARVSNLLKSRDHLQKYFYNEITLKSNDLKISEEYKTFLNRCITIVETHLTDPDFCIKTLALEVGMSHSNLYKKVKSVSGQSVNSFIRFIRLRKAATLLINTDLNVNEAAFQVGFNDLKYFREQFYKLFGSNPSDYIRKHRALFHKSYTVLEKTSK